MWLVAWGVCTAGSTIVLCVVSAVVIVHLYGSGVWTRNQVNLWGPIMVFAAITVPNVASLLVLKDLARKKWPTPPTPGPDVDTDASA